MNSNILQSINCPPARVYAIFMCAVVLFDLYSGYYNQAFSNFIGVIIGTILLWVLCAARLDFVAYSLLLLPVMFFIFLLTAVTYDQYLRGVHEMEQKRMQARTSNCGEEKCETKPVAPEPLPEPVPVPNRCPCQEESCENSCGL